MKRPLCEYLYIMICSNAISIIVIITRKKFKRKNTMKIKENFIKNQKMKKFGIFAEINIYKYVLLLIRIYFLYDKFQNHGDKKILFI